MWCCRDRKIRRQRAFTLIELVVATGLAASIMAAVLSVTVQMRRSRAGTDSGDSARRAVDAVTSLVEADLLNAEAFQSGPYGVEIRGLSCFEPEAGRTRHYPVTISYRVERVGGSCWLLRRQVEMTMAGRLIGRTELVCRGVAGLTVTAIRNQQEQEGLGQPEPKERSPIPRAASVAVTFDDQQAGAKGRTVRRIVYLR